jgi:hypothetical protein
LSVQGVFDRLPEDKKRFIIQKALEHRRATQETYWNAKQGKK